ncbi:DMT family transporter [Providencia rettgeri]|uniref:DMT family transporter n=1 Tax=Providencia rettgeri TaxID=587 RepID=A0AAP2JZ03_PRORE|nr:MULTISPECIES: DMT family transporter [Providencia]ELR5133792.1 DMT family transporter [Providencia rettgeri]ELR5136185.1 DMT family transporter [Providencia rettgeri]ELR5199197.1 DMT family transporter [Providencia rettgeri]MBQ0208421.1 DMT family transporter [Providencia rettgeri]MBQ0437608.1 DMT family transporter [Providencia rettgeri]
MSIYIFIALLNGICIVISRTLNGKLAQQHNAFYSSLINHFVGFLFLTIMVLIFKTYLFNFNEIPLVAFIGGIIGAFFVIINSYVLPLLGVMLTSILAICGQMISSLVIDLVNGAHSQNVYLQLIGIVLIIGGVSIHFIRRTN